MTARARKPFEMHLIVQDGGRLTSSKTACGRAGWLAVDFSDEYETALGERFEATTDKRKVTCKICADSTP